MPLYEYRCESCGQVTEFLESLKSKGGHTCKHCGSKRMTKEFSTYAAPGGSGSGGGGACGGGGSPFS